MAGLRVGLARRHSAHDGQTVMRLRTRSLRIQSRRTRTCMMPHLALRRLTHWQARAAAGAALPRPDLSGKLEALRLRPLTGAAAPPARAGPAPSHAGSVAASVAAVRSSPRPPRPPRVRHTGNLKQCGIVTPTGRVYSAGPGRWLYPEGPPRPGPGFNLKPVSPPSLEAIISLVRWPSPRIVIRQCTAVAGDCHESDTAGALGSGPPKYGDGTGLIFFDGTSFRSAHT